MMKMKLGNSNIFWSTLVLAMMVPSLVFAQGSRPPSTGEEPHRRLREGGSMERPQGHPSVGEGRPHTGSKSGRANPFSAEGMAEALNLNEEQTKKMGDLMMDYRKGMIQRQATLQVAMIELEEAVARPKLDMSAIEKEAKEKEAAATDITLFRVRSMAKAKEFLSDAQFDQFRELIEQRMTSGGYGGSRGMPHGRMGGMRSRHGMGMMEMGRGGPAGGAEDGYDEERSPLIGGCSNI
jgi:Spy/CpxP family protein refolding chaperone